MTEQRPATLVDSNVLLDLFTQDPEWSEWSRARLAEALDQGPVLVNQVVYGEVAYRFSTIEALGAVLTPDRFVRGNLPWAAAFLAATCYRDYRRRGGQRASILPDFFIGAHAAVLGVAAAHPGRCPLPHLLPHRRPRRSCLTLCCSGDRTQ